MFFWSKVFEIKSRTIKVSCESAGSAPSVAGDIKETAMLEIQPSQVETGKFVPAIQNSSQDILQQIADINPLSAELTAKIKSVGKDCLLIVFC